MWIAGLALAGLWSAQAASPELTDNFADRQLLTDDSGRIDGSNAGATREPGEPRHGGKPGGRSVWVSWLAPAGDNLTARLDQQKDVAELAKEMYLALLAREPDEAEQKEVSEYLASHANRRQAAIGNLVWALLASNEFCANH